MSLEIYTTWFVQCLENQNMKKSNDSKKVLYFNEKFCSEYKFEIKQITNICNNPLDFQ